MTASESYRQEIERWRAERLRKLAAEDGWLNLIGRWDLLPGSATVGAVSDSDIVLPIGPARVGVIELRESGDVVFTPSGGTASQPIAPNLKVPPRFASGRFLFEIMSIGDGLALRARDREHDTSASLPGIRYFDIDQDWRVPADWIPLDLPITAEVATMIGTVNTVTVTHKAAFSHGGVRYELMPSYGTAESPQFVIRDRTAGSETYAAARFLYGEGIAGGKIVLDFNKAINPPCAFTDFAVCPLPPPQNVLPFRIEAGEFKPAI